MTLNKRNLLIGGAVVLVIVGAVLVFITEPSGAEGSDESGGVADVSEETRPYLWHGIALIVVGLVVGVVGWRTEGNGSGSS